MTFYLQLERELQTGTKVIIHLNPLKKFFCKLAFWMFFLFPRNRDYQCD